MKNKAFAITEFLFVLLLLGIFLGAMMFLINKANQTAKQRDAKLTEVQKVHNLEFKYLGDNIAVFTFEKHRYLKNWNGGIIHVESCDCWRER